jgi:hypothetical protein
MASSTVRTGELAQAVVGGTRIQRMTQWDLTDQISETVWGDSDSCGYDVRRGNRRGATGSVQAKYETGQKPYTVFKPGDCVTLILWENTDDSSSYWYFAEVLIQSFALTFNQDSKEVVGWTASWGSSGRYYQPYESGAPAATVPADTPDCT